MNDGCSWLPRMKWWAGDDCHDAATGNEFDAVEKTVKSLAEIGGAGLSDEFNNALASPCRVISPFRGIAALPAWFQAPTAFTNNEENGHALRGHRRG